MQAHMAYDLCGHVARKLQPDFDAIKHSRSQCKHFDVESPSFQWSFVMGNWMGSPGNAAVEVEIDWKRLKDGKPQININHDVKLFSRYFPSSLTYAIFGLNSLWLQPRKVSCPTARSSVMQSRAKMAAPARSTLLSNSRHAIASTRVFWANSVRRRKEQISVANRRCSANLNCLVRVALTMCACNWPFRPSTWDEPIV